MRTKAIQRPSGDQAGARSTVVRASPVSRSSVATGLTAPVATSTVSTRIGGKGSGTSGAGAVTNAMRRPSGDHDGAAASIDVSGRWKSTRSPLPSGLIVASVSSRRTNAIVRLSGAQLPVRPPRTSRRAPVPSARMIQRPASPPNRIQRPSGESQGLPTPTGPTPRSRPPCAGTETSREIGNAGGPPTGERVTKTIRPFRAGAERAAPVPASAARIARNAKPRSARPMCRVRRAPRVDG